MTNPSENPKFDKKSGKRNSPELPPSEGDFWDLEGEDEDSSASAITPEPRSPRVDSDAPAPSQPRTQPETTLDAKPEESSRTPSSRKPDPEDQLEPRTLLEAARDGISSLSNREKLAILGAGTSVLLVAIWALSLFFSTIPTDSPDEKVTFPVAGQIATIQSLSTYWREPNAETDRGVRNEARLIPAAKVILEASSQTGALRILFQDDAERIIGDAITVAITDGQFSNGAADIEVYATEGFTDEGDHAAYLTEQIGKWYIIVKEGPDTNSPGSAFSDLLRVPISNTRR